MRGSIKGFTDKINGNTAGPQTRELVYDRSLLIYRNENILLTIGIFLRFFIMNFKIYSSKFQLLML